MKTVWLLLDDRIGSVGQARGVGQALDNNVYEVFEKKIEYTKWGKLPNWIKGKSLIGLTPESKKGLSAPYPDLVISASRRTATIALWIKKKSKNHTKIVQLMHPGSCGLKDLDLIFVPEHDREKKGGDNVFYITGAPHRINEKSLQEAKTLWEKEFEKLPRPLTAVIIGGSIKGVPFSLHNAITLAHDIKKFKEEIDGSALVTDSKRTGAEAERIILHALRDFPSYNYLWGSTGANPYMGYLACADNIIVTGDSVSMCSEACGTGKPVFIFTGRDWLTPKHNRFVQSLYDGGYAAPLSVDNEGFQPKAALNPVAYIITKINELF